MIREAIEGLLDVIHCLTRQVARLEDLRERLRKAARRELEDAGKKAAFLQPKPQK